MLDSKSLIKKYYMKKILKGTLYITFASTVLFSGCKKSFLEEPKPATAVSGGDVFATEAGVRANLSGMYRNLRTQYGTSTDAWGIASVNLAREVRGLDVGLPDGNWYNFDYLHDNREPTYRRTSFTWNFFYDFINASNVIIDGVEKGGLPDATKIKLTAEARAFRAWCYFELVREYAHSYSENPNGPGLPIYTVPTTALTAGSPRANISEVYSLIISDLEYAAANSATTRNLKDVINKDVVNGLLARVYLEVGMVDKAQLPKAIAAAQAARAAYPLTSTELTSPMTSDFAAKKEVIWGFPQAADQTVYYGTPSAFWGTSGTGYFNFYVDPNFVSLFSPTDVRASKFVTPAGATYVGVKKFKTTKFGATTNFVDFLVMMRSPEMLLIEAEAKARLADPTANDLLFSLQKNRNAAAVQSGNTGNALIAEILLERRKELFGEIGVGFLDIKRCNLPLNRSNGHVVSAQLQIPANSDRFTLKIPQAEFDSNKALTTADQNK
jgi:hypothetical protein